MKCIPLIVLVAALFVVRALQAQNIREPSEPIVQPAVDLDSAAVSSSLQDGEEVLRPNKNVVMPSGLNAPPDPGAGSASEMSPGPSQSLVFRTDFVRESLFGSDSLSVDSLPPPRKTKLLPDNISFMENGLWGENGIVRGIGIASPLTPEVRKHELAVRRTMLTMHQIGGFVTLGLMGTALYSGQKYLDHGQRSDLSLHQSIVTATIISYGATAALSVLSPPPLIRRDETSTTTLHKTLAWIHFAGMIITPLLASAITERGPAGRHVDVNRARYHQTAAYITTAVFAASMIVVTF